MEQFTSLVKGHFPRVISDYITDTFKSALNKESEDKAKEELSQTSTLSQPKPPLKKWKLYISPS
ncbi:MAG: hypothetical protein MZV63_14930 [Marinilabiliales bacterium]|nr:hypothetical protein [Marinilabiliales bacterium]